ncbi:MAG TPA: hypothetical protein DCP69_02320 [Candidatus Omnitrophica bacterium]|nr:hypothetical protein [Candidatus Omnitrophota bacterium]
MLTPLQVWRRVYDDVGVWGATLAGIVASMAWPLVLAMALHGTLPRFALTDLIRILGAAIIAVVLAVRADKDTPLDARKGKAAIKRRVNAAFARGFAWQGAIAALTAAATSGT